MRMKGMVWIAMAVLCWSTLAAAAEESELGFGFGGGGVSAFFPALEGVNAFLSENGLDPMPAFLVGGCGGGRGGVIGGLSIGGMGFGVAGSSVGTGRSAELSLGGGGLDLGFALGGDETSVLTLGAVLGGGASVLELSFPGVEPQGIVPEGIVPEPTTRTLGRGFAFVLPYVSFEAQLLPFIGCEVRIGYLLPVLGFDFGETTGIPAPSVDLSGPYVGFSIVFGGIARANGASGGAEKASAAGVLELVSVAKLTVETGAGEVTVSSYAPDATQTGPRTVEWSAVWDADEAGEAPVAAASGPDGASLRSTQDTAIRYVLRVPSGTDLDITCGAGAIHVVGHSARSVRVSLGVGEASLVGLNAGDVSVSAGVGEIAIEAAGIGKLAAHAGIGRVAVTLPAGVSATISASAGLGDATIEGFPSLTVRDRGFLWTSATDAVIGAGSAECSLSVGIGDVQVRAASPVPAKP